MSEHDQQDGGASGGPGDNLIDPQHPRRDLALLARFPIRGNGRERVADQVLAIAVDPESSIRNKLAAAKVLAVFDKLNMDQEKRDLGIADQTVSVTTQVAVQVTDAVAAARTEMQDDSEYLDGLRAQAGQGNSQPGDLGNGRQQRPVEDGGPSSGGRPGPNGNGKAK